MWSGPRTVSTALMRAWENRPDTAVVDEPLYAFYLDRTGIDHPGRAEILASQPNDWRVVLDQLTRGPVPGGKTVLYAKHMTHHLLPEVDRRALAPLRHAHLIRDPAGLLASYAKVRSAPTLADLGIVQQAEIFAEFGGPCARPWVCRSTRPCCPGRPGRGTATGCGGPTGTPASGGPPGSAPTGRRPGRCRRTWPAWPISAARTMSGCGPPGCGRPRTRPGTRPSTGERHAAGT